jgi:hypothetical protein
MDKELKQLVERLHRIFPNTTINYEGEIFNSSEDYEDFAPPRELDWFEVIERLKKEGLEIANRKENKRTKCHCGKPINFSNPDCAAFSLCNDCQMDS